MSFFTILLLLSAGAVTEGMKLISTPTLSAHRPAGETVSFSSSALKHSMHRKAFI